MPKTRWKHPKHLRMALAEYIAQRSGMAVTEADLASICANVGERVETYEKRKSKHLGKAGDERFAAALTALAEQTEKGTTDAT